MDQVSFLKFCEVQTYRRCRTGLIHKILTASSRFGRLGVIVMVAQKIDLLA